MKKAFLFFTFIAMAFMSVAQLAVVEKLKKVLKSHPTQDTFRVNRLNELLTNTSLTSLGEREKYATEALFISDKINYTSGYGNALAILGSIKLIEGKREESKILFLRADSIAKKTRDPGLQAKVLWRSSFLLKDANERILQLRQADSLAKKTTDFYWQVNILLPLAQALSLNEPVKGLSYFFEAEALAEKSGNKELLRVVQSNIGSSYMVNLSNYAKAMEYFLKTLHIAEEINDPRALINSWINLGNIYSAMGDQHAALTYLLKAENANKKLGNRSVESILQTSIGERYLLSNRYPEAIEAYNKALKLINEPADLYIIQGDLADAYVHMGNLPLAFQYGFIALKGNSEAKGNSAWIDDILSRAYLKKNMADSAIYYAAHGFEEAKKEGTLEHMRDNSLSLSNAYAFIKDFEKAYKFRLLYMNYRDSMINEEVRHRTAVQQYTFNLDKKQLQIITLNDQKKYQHDLLIGAIILMFLIFAAALFLLYNNRQKQKANKLLHQQKQEIDEKAGDLATQKDNVELLSAIGRKITSSLSVETIIGTVYDNVNSLMDASVFGIGIYNEAGKRIEFPATYEEGKALPFYYNSIEDENRFGVECFKEGKEIVLGNLDKDYKTYIRQVATPDEGKQAVSLIYLPLTVKEKSVGVITVQSFKPNAYSEYHLFMLRNIAIYTAIALENATSFVELKSAQKQLIQSEKMASLGELTAGIAHEIQNPLNFVNNFSDVNQELLVEMKDEMKKGNLEDADAIVNDIIENEQKINHHGKRADAIVKGMLQHSRQSSGHKESTNINALADEYLRLSYHGLRAKDKTFIAEMKTDFDGTIGKISVIPQDIGRVLLNLFNNAFYAVNEQKNRNPESYMPTVSVTTIQYDNKVQIIIKDNGKGIPQNIVDKIFQPFFTTKPTGEGTGLGLSLAYDIIKAHGGELKVESKENEGSEFVIQLPMA